MNTFSALSIPVAVALALVAGTSVAQERPNTTLVQKAKAAKAAKSVGPSTAPASETSGRVDARRVAPTATQTSPAMTDVDHECPGRGSDA